MQISFHFTFTSIFCLFPPDLLGPEKAGFLCELLDTIGRKDLTATVREYMDKVDRKLKRLEPEGSYLPANALS